MGFLNYGPMQTAPASLDDLHRREEDEGLVISRAPDYICGFISGRPGASFACPVDDYCYFFPPASIQTPAHNRVVCCDETSCEYFTTCYNSKEYFSASKCTDGCEVDNFILKCTESDYPYCHTVSWEGNTIDYSCNDVDITTIMSAALSYKGEEERTFATLNEKQLDSILSQLSEASTAEITDGTATRTSAPSATDADSDSGGSGNHTGAIVGGVVGGVAAIALVVVAILLFLRLRKKKKAQAANPPAYQQTPPGGENKAAWQPGQQQQPGAPYYYDPHGGATQTTTPSMAASGVASPNSGYSQMTVPAGYQPQQQAAIHEAEAEVISDKPQELADGVAVKKPQEPVELA
ncbi:hypothetical protein ACHAPT_007179 [Fusarium lateritium]